ncbi:MAG: efflux RND transporter periplasmic adaptor subunit [Sterolibacterium sp.]|nr:efflux RND transporter periplasmic adaptor subunit [Sterolibacterium sp.]MBP9714693.1 efflux RND transporter periplasmic adaptor subunit [Sterolibacterium sp.]
MLDSNSPNPLFTILLLAGLCLSPGLLLADEPKTAPHTLNVTAEQTRQLGIKTLQAGKNGALLQGGLPARVVVPNEQLRILSAPLPGLVQALYVAPGMRVKKGQVLAQLNSREAAELQRDLRQTAAQAELSRQTWQRDQTLFKEGLIPEARLQTSRAAWQQAEAAAAERRQTHHLVGQINASGVTLTAPIDGVVLEQNVTPGQRVDAAANLYTLARLGELWLEIQVPADLAPQLKPGLNVAVNEVRGKIMTVGAAVQAATQSVLVRARLEMSANGESLPLRPGQTVAAAIELPGIGSTRLPAAALIRHEGKTLVFISEPGGYRIREVRVEKESGDGVLVSGLKPDETVVVQGASGLKALLAGVGAE